MSDGGFHAPQHPELSPGTKTSIAALFRVGFMMFTTRCVLWLWALCTGGFSSDLKQMAGLPWWNRPQTASGTFILIGRTESPCASPSQDVVNVLLLRKGSLLPMSLMRERAGEVYNDWPKDELLARLTYEVNCSYLTWVIRDERHCLFVYPPLDDLRSEHGQLFHEAHSAMRSLMWHKDQKSCLCYHLAIVPEA